jgi:hypothetical protein
MPTSLTSPPLSTLAEQALPLLVHLSEDNAIFPTLVEANLVPRYAGFFDAWAVICFSDESYLTCPASGPPDWKAFPSLAAVQEFFALAQATRPANATLN